MLFSVCRFPRAALEPSAVEQNASRMCSAHTTASNPVIVLLSPATLFTCCWRKSYVCFWRNSVILELANILTSSGQWNEKVNTQPSLQASQMHSIENSIIKCGVLWKVRSGISAFIFHFDSISFSFRLKVERGHSLIRNSGFFPWHVDQFYILHARLSCWVSSCLHQSWM